MTRSARPTRSAARQTEDALERLLDGLRRERVRHRADGAPGSTEPATAQASSTVPVVAAAPVATALGAAPVARGPAEAVPVGLGSAPPGDEEAAINAPLRLPHPDWLHHRLAVTGAAETVADFQAAACGAGTIPWTLDLDRTEEDLFHLLVAPPAPQRRRLSLAGARVLAGQLREAVAMRHAAAIRRVERSQAGATFQPCPFDLHALVPVPADMLRLGPDHPDALAWLWAHWGTTDALRHVALAPGMLRTPPPAGSATLQLTFWSADWTPWRALAAVAARWPALRFDIRPTYGTL